MFSFGLVCVDQISACVFVRVREKTLHPAMGQYKKKQKKYIQFPQAPSSRLNE